MTTRNARFELHELCALDHGIERGIDRELNGLSALVTKVEAVRVPSLHVEAALRQLFAERRHIDCGRNGKVHIERRTW